MWPYAIKGEIALSLYIPLHYTLTLNDEHTDAKGRNTNACDNFPYLNGRLWQVYSVPLAQIVKFCGKTS